MVAAGRLAASVLAITAIWELGARAPGTLPDILLLIAAFALLAAESAAHG